MSFLTCFIMVTYTVVVMDMRSLRVIVNLVEL